MVHSHESSAACDPIGGPASTAEGTGHLNLLTPRRMMVRSPYAPGAGSCPAQVSAGATGDERRPAAAEKDQEMPQSLADDAGVRKGGMQVITRAAAILGALAEARGGQNLSQLASRTGLPKTTVHRICAALEQVGYVRVDETTGLRELGRGLQRLAVLGRRDLLTLLEPYLEQLSRDLNETVDLAVLDGSRVLFVAQRPAPQRALMAIARVGAHFPAYSLASGKVLLALLSSEEVVRLLPRRLEPTLGGRPRTREALLLELEQVRATGLGFEREEIRHGICAVAVAVTDVDGRSASIAVPMPTTRFQEDEELVAARLLALRDSIQEQLSGTM
jgi:DNA-binding IclR family transcriptional regulator